MSQTVPQRYPRRELFIRLGYFVFGTAICALGCAAFMLTNTGVDPFSVLMQGVARSAGISNGVAHICINLTLLVIIFLVDRKYIRIATFAALVITGPMIDLSTLLFKPIIGDFTPLPLRYIIAAFCCCVLGFGLSMVINAGVGMGANDLTSVLLSDKLRIQFRWVRITVDCTCVVSGFLLGGSIGVGTLVCAALIGPIAQFCMAATARPLASLLARYARR